MGFLFKEKTLPGAPWQERRTDLAVSRFAHDLAASLSSLAMGLETLESPSLPATERALALKISRQAVRVASARLSLWRLAFSLSSADERPAHDLSQLFQQLMDAVQLEGRMDTDREMLPQAMARLIAKVLLAFGLSLNQKITRVGAQISGDVFLLTLSGERVHLPAEYALCLPTHEVATALDQRSAFFLLLRDQLEGMGYTGQVVHATETLFEIRFHPL